MPFVSKAQQGYLYAKHPKVAAEFASGMSKKDFKKLPEHKVDKQAAYKRARDANV